MSGCPSPFGYLLSWKNLTYSNPAGKIRAVMSKTFGDRFHVDLVLGENCGIGIPEFSPGQPGDAALFHQAVISLLFLVFSGSSLHSTGLFSCASPPYRSFPSWRSTKSFLPLISDPVHPKLSNPAFLLKLPLSFFQPYNWQQKTV